MKSARSLAGILLFLSLGILAGCGPVEAEVSGTVLVDEKPLKEGQIIFEEANKSIAPNEGKIVDGKYAMKVFPGSKVVRINASRAPAKPDPVMGYAPLEGMIAEEFNAKTTLTAEIKPGKNEGMDFKVKSIPQK